jgi:hypothetical protein
LRPNSGDLSVQYPASNRQCKFVSAHRVSKKKHFSTFGHSARANRVNLVRAGRQHVSFAGPQQFQVAVGINKTPADKGQEPKERFTRVAGDGALIQWVEQRSNGGFGAAVILPAASKRRFRRGQAQCADTGAGRRRQAAALLRRRGLDQVGRLQVRTGLAALRGGRGGAGARR